LRGSAFRLGAKNCQGRHFVRSVFQRTRYLLRALPGATMTTILPEIYFLMAILPSGAKQKRSAGRCQALLTLQNRFFDWLLRQGRTRMRRNSWKIPTTNLIAIGVLLLIAVSGWSADRVKSETIEATAMGTGSQLGQMIGITLNIYQYSTPEDKQLLVQAFEKGKNQGLVNALQKMKAVGHIEITGTLGYDCSFIRMIPTPTGRRIRFITNRQIRFAEAYWDTNSQQFNLTGGEFDLNDTDKSKSTGTLFPAAELVIDKEKQLQLDLNQNSWKLNDVLDWMGTVGVN
jgi:hypothetical protein